MIKQLIKFITTGIWELDENKYKSRSKRWAVRQFKILTITAKGFGAHTLNIRSAALTFYALMAIVPIAAVVFGVVKGFGIDQKFIESLHTSMPQYNTLIDYVIEFADNLIQRTKGGWLMGVGSVVFLWAIIKVFSNIESSFNHIWEVHKSRSLARKMSDYLTIIFIAPLLWVASNSLSIYLKSTIAYYTGNTVIEFLYTVASFIAAWFMFTFVYKMMPNTKVKFSCALNAGIIAGTIFQIFQIVYLYIQSEVSAYNAIYGSFAALPLFLIWMQASWQILLFGTELSYAYQNIYSYEKELEVGEINYRTRTKVMVSVMCEVIKHFKQNKGAISPETIASNLEMSSRLVFDVIFELDKANLICAVKDDSEDKISKYIPARDINTIRISDVIMAIQEQGKDISEIACCDNVNKISVQIKSLEDTMEDSIQNKLLIDLIATI